MPSRTAPGVRSAGDASGVPRRRRRRWEPLPRSEPSHSGTTQPCSRRARAIVVAPGALIGFSHCSRGGWSGVGVIVCRPRARSVATHCSSGRRPEGSRSWTHPAIRSSSVLLVLGTAAVVATLVVLEHRRCRLRLAAGGSGDRGLDACRGVGAATDVQRPVVVHHVRPHGDGLRQEPVRARARRVPPRPVRAPSQPTVAPPCLGLRSPLRRRVGVRGVGGRTLRARRPVCSSNSSPHWPSR